MSARVIEVAIYSAGIVGVVIAVFLPSTGITGFQRDLLTLVPKFAVWFFVMTTFICGPFVTRERKKIASISDTAMRTSRERALVKKMSLVGLAFAAVLLGGYFIGRAL